MIHAIGGVDFQIFKEPTSEKVSPVVQIDGADQLVEDLSSLSLLLLVLTVKVPFRQESPAQVSPMTALTR